MILLDTTVLLAYLRRPKDGIRKQFRILRAAICGVTRAEILHGARNDEDAERLIKVLNEFWQVPIPSDIWDELGRNLSDLRRHGITVPFQDALIATIAIRNHLELWAHDRHYPLMQAVLPDLKLFQEST